MPGIHSKGPKPRRLAPRLFRAFALVSLAIVLHSEGVCAAPQSPATAGQEAEARPAPGLPRGKKLMLKEGGFHLVREYEIEGDRVRYYSLERSQWEEIPVAIVDWEATRKIAGEEAERDAALVSKLKKREEAQRVEPLDIDASLEAAPGVFLPQGEGAFVFDGKAITALTQASAGSNLSKRRLVEQVVVPIKVVPALTKVSVKGPRAKIRVKSEQPEFYMRTADQREPEMELVRAKVHGDSREIEDIDVLFNQKQETRKTAPMQRWQVARGVYRFTLGEALEPGEYALVEIVRDEGMNLFVWDFGVDAAKK